MDPSTPPTVAPSLALVLECVGNSIRLYGDPHRRFRSSTICTSDASYLVDRDGLVRKILPPFSDLQVSGVGAADQLLLHRSGNWTWEDLEYSTMHPVGFYRVYRGQPGDVFQCIHSTADPGWPGGDPVVPTSGALLAYLVTAVNPSGEESSSGEPERTLSDPCPAPPP